MLNKKLDICDAPSPENEPRLCSGVRVQREPLPIRRIRLLVVSTRVWCVRRVTGCRNRRFVLGAQ